MHVVSLDGLPSIAIDEDDVPGACLFIGRVSNHTNELTVEERELVIGSEERQREFASGRRLAHAALQHLVGEPSAVLRKERRPVWPDGVIGSISHSRTIAACAVARTDQYVGIGIDIAGVATVSERVASRVLVDEERDWITATASSEWRSALFSAKEAVYKAVNPAVGEYLGFTDVALTVDTEGLSFTARTSVDRASTATVALGRGFFHRLQGHWLTQFIVDRKQPA